MGEPTLLTCGICGGKSLPIHHLTDCIDVLRARAETAEAALTRMRADSAHEQAMHFKAETAADRLITEKDKALAAARRAIDKLADAAAEKARAYAMRAAGQREHGSADEAMYLEARGNSWRDAEEMIRAALAAPAPAPSEETKNG